MFKFTMYNLVPTLISHVAYIYACASNLHLYQPGLEPAQLNDTLGVARHPII